MDAPVVVICGGVGAARLLRGIHIDGLLLAGILLIMAIGLLALYSAVGQSASQVTSQLARMSAALLAMLIMAQVPPGWLRRLSPFVYLGGLFLLMLVLVSGDVGKGAQRWLDVGVRFQPSEIMKLGVC